MTNFIDAQTYENYLASNEKLLNDLQSVNSEVSTSMLTTIGVVKKLSEAYRKSESL